jgi:hypothetical protein
MVLNPGDDIRRHLTDYPQYGSILPPEVAREDGLVMRYPIAEFEERIEAAGYEASFYSRAKGS